jgi:subtilisin-like proprotein convertase family protein
MGPYTSHDIRRHGELWFPPIAGDTLVVDLYWPEELIGVEPALHLGTVSHGYKPFGVIGREADLTRDFGDSGACNIDVACPLGDNWQDEKRGVVILLSGGSYFCSGSLINTTADDCRPYVLTAAHCGADASTTFGFNFERPGCNSGTPADPGNESVTGAVVLANWGGVGTTDFTLLEMDLQPPESFNHYYNGWSRDTAAAAECWAIHHPSGDAKKISYNADPLIDGTNYGPNHWRITEWEEGTTEGGSSGSPLFDPGHRIIGQLHGGQASCTNITWDEYGKIDGSWTGGGAPGSRLSDWLDPDGTGAITVDGVDYQTCLFQPAGSVDLDLDLYVCTTTLTIRVRDDSLQGDPSLTVTLSSDTEPAPETLTLPAEAPGSGKFSTTFPIDAVAAVNGDGILSVNHGDTTTVEYLDADDGAGGTNILVQDTALVDCLSPLITNVQASNVTASSATVTWDTDEIADSTVVYSLQPPGSKLEVDSALVTQHSIRLTDLPECSFHGFSVASTDAAGNAASDDNGGSLYSFETVTQSTTDHSSTGSSVAIPDNDPAGASKTIGVSDTETVSDVDVLVNITHPYVGDLVLSLIPPVGPEIVLSARHGGGGDNYTGTLFDDEAATPISAGSAPYSGSYRPDSPLSAADGISAVGDWILKVVDQAGGDIGDIDSWTLRLAFPAACAASATYDTHLLDEDLCASGGPGTGNGYWETGEEIRFSLSVKNNGIGLTGVSARVTPLTAGVVMLDDTATLADLPAGWLGTTEPPHVTALLPQGLGCGSLLDFEVEILANEGSFIAPFDQVVGEVVPGAGVALSEDFELGIPGSWTIVDGSSDGHTWYADDAIDPAGCGNDDPLAPIAGTWAAVDSDCAGSGVAMDEELITPLIDLSAAIDVTVDFDHWFRQFGPELCDLDVRSSLTGGLWVNVAQWTGASTANPQHESVDITAQTAGANDVQLRWHYHNADFEWTWFVDNVEVGFTSVGACNMDACAGGSTGPPPVPDDMLASRDTVDGSVISIDWNDVCSPASTKILWGPLDQVSSYTISGAECGIANPAVWDPAPVGDIWFLLVTDDGADIESSWGQSSSGERNGTTTSATCGSTAKDPTGICP